jgi:hypothetical protein
LGEDLLWWRLYFHVPLGVETFPGGLSRFSLFTFFGSMVLGFFPLPSA